MNNETLISLIIGGLVTLITTIIAGVAINRTSRQEEKMEEFSKAITSLQNTAVTDSHVRNIVKEEIQPIQVGMGEILKTLHKLEIHMAKEEGYKAGASNRRRLSDFETEQE